MLFAVVNLARHVRLDPEAALARTNAKFVRRFRYIEQELAERGRDACGSARSTRWMRSGTRRRRPSAG